MSTPKDPWLRIGLDSWWLGFEASTVIGLRALKIAAGGAVAGTEARQMVLEKIEAGVGLQTMAMTGELGFSAPRAGAKAISHYRGKVRANRRRLAKG